jgi:hypothetical protein
LLHKFYLFFSGGPEFWKPGRRLCVHHSAGRWTRDRGDDPMVDWAIWWKFIVFVMKLWVHGVSPALFPQSCMSWDHFGGLTRFAGNQAPRGFFQGGRTRNVFQTPRIPQVVP